MNNSIIIKNKIQKFNKVIRVSGDKSISIRWVLFSSLAKGISKARNLLLSEDVFAAINFISNHEDYKNTKIGLLSICMGAASSTFAFGMEKEIKNFKNLKSMIAVQPLTYDYFLENLGLPKFILNSGSKYSKNKRNTDLTGDSFLPYVKDISIPTMIIQNQNDPSGRAVANVHEKGY